MGCLLGFQALLRASEFCGGALGWCHVEVITGGLRLCVPYSKTKRTPHLVSVATGSDENFDLTTALCGLLEMRRHSTDGVVSMSYDKFNSMLQDFYLRAVGDNVGVSSHGLRRGGASTLVYQGVPEEAIMALGRWTSKAWKEYVDLSALHQLAASLALTC